MSGRKRFVQDRATGNLIEVSDDFIGNVRGPNGMLIMDDLPDFVSPIDGTIVRGRAGLREHELVHQVTNVSDFTETWAKAAKVRESRMNGTFDSASMKETLIREYNRRER